jgi:hypothetical protein
VHALVIQSLVLGTAAKKLRVPDLTSPGSISSASRAVSKLTLVVINLTDAVVPKEDLLEEFASRGALPKNLPIAIVTPDSAPEIDIPAETLTQDPEPTITLASGDPAGQARLFGIYSGQIQARIERIWRRPRTPVEEHRKPSPSNASEEAFRCQAQIIQDATGTVQEILLPRCNGSAAWQRSLVVAIQQASPLPAPPSPSAFSSAMSLTFTGIEFSPGSSPDGYEVEIRPKRADH